MSSKTVSSSSDEDVSLEGPDAKSAPCDLIDSTYSVLGSFIADKNNGMEEAHTDNDQPEEDDGVDVIDEESVSENQGVLEGVQDLIGSDTGIYPKIHHSTEEQSSTTQIAESCDLGKSSSSSDTTAKKAGLPKIFAQVPLDMKMNLVFFIISTLLLAGYMQCRIDYVLQEYNEYKSETQEIIKAIQDDHNKYKLESQGLMEATQDDHSKHRSETQDIIKAIQDDLNKFKLEYQGLMEATQDDHNKYKLEYQGLIKAIQDDLNKYKLEYQGLMEATQDDHNKHRSETQGIIKTIQDDHNKYKSESQNITKTIQFDLKQERNKNDLLSKKMESINTQLEQFQHGVSAAMSAYIKNQFFQMKTNLCPVFVEILQAVEFFVQTGDHSNAIETCGEVIWKCLVYGKVQIELFLESDGLHLLESLLPQQQEILFWPYVLHLLFDRRNEVHCAHYYVSHILHLLDSDIYGEKMSQYASGILCKCLDDDDVWGTNTEPTKHQVSEAVSKAIEAWKWNLIGLFGYGSRLDMEYISRVESMVTWVKKSSASAQQHFAVWILFGEMTEEISDESNIKYHIGEVILEEILKDPRPHPHTKYLIRQILDK